MELRRYMSLAWKWLWLIVLGAVVAAGLAYVVGRSTTPIYRASALLLVNEGPDPTVNDYTSILASQQLVQTYAERLIKVSVFEEVMRRLNLTKWDLQVSVSPIRDTQLLVLQVEHSDPALAVRVANAIPEVFAEQNEQLQRARFAAAKDRLSQQLATLEEEMDGVRAQLAGLEGSQKLADQAEVRRLQDTLDEYQSSYQFALRNYQNIRLAETQAMNSLLVDQPAMVPEKPVRPRVMLNTLLAAMIGAILAAGIALTVEYLDDTIKVPEDVQQGLGLLMLGGIARHEVSNGRLITIAQPRSPISEAYRGLRTNLQFSSWDQPLKAIMVTSANPAEGKSTTVANLAVVVAQAGLSVIVVDSDLRHPALHEMLGVASARGLANAMLQPEPDVEAWLTATGIENVRLLASGPLPPNPSELLGSQRMRLLVEQLEQLADLVLFDSPPLMAVTDAAVLANLVDGVLLVVKAGKTRRDVVQHAVDNLRHVDAHLLGVVLNQLQPGRGTEYYSIYYRSRTDRPDAEDQKPEGKERRRLPVIR